MPQNPSPGITRSGEAASRCYRGRSRPKDLLGTSDPAEPVAREIGDDTGASAGTSWY
jgi:hypothetical protein